MDSIYLYVSTFTADGDRLVFKRTHYSPEAHGRFEGTVNISYDHSADRDIEYTLHIVEHSDEEMYWTLLKDELLMSILPTHMLKHISVL